MPEHLIWLILASLMIGLAKGGLSTMAGLAVPFLAIFMNPIEAAALTLPVFLVTDWFAVWLYRQNASMKNVAILVPSSLAGIAVATIIVGFAPESLLLILTASVGLWTCLRSWLGNSADTAARPPEVGRGVFWGVITGITTFITHTGAPPAQMYLLPQKLSRLAFAGTMAIVFAIANLSKLPGYHTLGLFQDFPLGLAASLAGVGLVGTAVGRQIVLRLTDQAYVRIVEVMLFVLSMALFWKAFSIQMGA